MAKILIEGSVNGDTATEAVKLEGTNTELADLLLRGAAAYLLQVKKPEKTLYDACIAFGVSLYKVAADMAQKGQTHCGVYIEREG